MKYKREVNNKMKWQGDTDVQKGIIRVNKTKSKKKSSVIDTIVHEESHAKHPKKTEKEVRKLTKALVKKLGPSEKARLYSKYQ